MNSKITSSKIKQTLDRIKSGKHPDTTVRKRRLSRVILLIDGLVIILILMFVYNRQSDKMYVSQTVTYDDNTYRFSISGIPEEKKLFFSLSIHSGKKKSEIIRFNKALATVSVMYNNTVIYNDIFGENISSLKLKPDESKTFVLQAKKELIETYANEHPGILINASRKIISFEKTDLPVTAELTLHTEKKITTALHFNYEVQ